MSTKVLVVMPVEVHHKKMFNEAIPEGVFNYVAASEVTVDIAREADIIVGNISPALIKDSNNLKLLQLNSAGTDGYTAEGVLPENTMLCNATGAYGLAISEHMIGMLLTLMKKLDRYSIDTRNHDWIDHGPVTSIYGSKTLVVGLGDIGSEFAIRMNALGSEVSAIRRNQSGKPDYIQALYQTDRLYECLENADIVATSLPGTNETYHMFDREAFSHMKKGAFFINVGRGTAVDSDALYDALVDGQLAGAAIDVTEPEPLPSEHKLWTAPNLLVTPHVSGGYHLMETHDRIIRIACRNIRNCIDGLPYENEVDMNTGYRKFKD